MNTLPLIRVSKYRSLQEQAIDSVTQVVLRLVVPSPSEISDSAIADNGRTSTACQTSFVYPQVLETR